MLLRTTEQDAVTRDSNAAIRTFGDYELLEEIARGGMGIVFRARQISLNREVAVKLMRDSALARPEDVRRFRAEAAAAANLRHPNIVAIHEVGELDGQRYFAMDLIDGTNLAERTREGPLPPQEAAALVAVIAGAVQHAHEHGTLHRDLKPSNVLIDAAGNPFVTDFGLTRPLDGDSSLTLTGQVLGTPGYMPPEQAAGRGAAEPSADIYSLGALLYHLLTGRAPFVGRTTVETLRHVIEQEPVSPQLLNPEVPRDLTSVCLKCLSKNPLTRYRSARAMAEDLQRFLRCEPTLARPTPPHQRVWLWCRRKPAWAALILALVGLIAMGGAALSLQMRHARQQAEQERQASVMLSAVLKGIGPQLALARSSAEVRRLLEENTARIENEFPANSEVRAQLLTTFGESWMAVGDFARAQNAFLRALKLQEQASGKSTSAMADILTQLGRSQRSGGQLEQSEKTLRRALALARSLKESLPLARALHQLGVTLSYQRNYREAEEFLQEALNLNLAASAAPTVETASVQCDLAYVRHSLGKISGLEDLLNESLRARRMLLGDLHPDVASTLCEIARIRFTQKRFADARALTEEAVKIRQTVFGSNHVETIKTEWLYATLVRDEGELDQAENLICQLLPRIEQAWGRNHVFTQSVRSGLARLYDYERKQEKALDLWLRLLASDFAPEEVLRGLEGLVAPVVFSPVLAETTNGPVLWHFTTNTTASGEMFDSAQAWPLGPAPFGSRDTSARTLWESEQIGLWTRFSAPHSGGARQLVVRARHDDELHLWINGKLAVTSTEWSHGNHWLYLLPGELQQALTESNVVAATVRDRDGGAHANIELYSTADPPAALRLVRQHISERLAQAPHDAGWWRARGRAELDLQLGNEAAADFKEAYHILSQNNHTNDLALAELRMLQGEAELLQQEVEFRPNRPPDGNIEASRALHLLRQAEKDLNRILSRDDWRCADVSDLVGAALIQQVRLKLQSPEILQEAEKKLSFARDTIEKTSRYPDALREKRLARSTRHFAALRDVQHLYQIEANK